MSAARSRRREARIAEKETREAENHRVKDGGKDGKQQHLAGCDASAEARVEADVCFQSCLFVSLQN